MNQNLQSLISRTDYPLLEKLSTARGVAGQEAAVRAILSEAVTPHVASVESDHLGNLIARKPALPGNGDKPLRVMLAAHMDEVGGLVQKVNDDGTLKFRAVGGIDARILPGKRLLVGPKALPGVVLEKPVHLGRSESAATIDDLVIDMGGANGINPGDMITFDSGYAEVGRLLKGKSFDDRVGCFILAELLKWEYPCEVVGVFTVQEEIGLRGAKVAAYSVAPDVAFALEGTIADDLPKDEDISSTTEVGKGPAISVMDRSAYADRRLVDLLRARFPGRPSRPWPPVPPGVVEYLLCEAARLAPRASSTDAAARPSSVGARRGRWGARRGGDETRRTAFRSAG